MAKIRGSTGNGILVLTNKENHAKIKRMEVLEKFRDVGNFKYVYQQRIDAMELEDYLEL